MIKKIIYLGIILGGWLLIVMGALGVMREASLRNNFRTVDATITDVQGDDNGGYLGQYSFVVNNVTYTSADMTGRRNLWVTIPSYDTQSIQVIYSPDDPWNNRPLQPDGDPMAGAWIGLLCGFLAIGLGGAALWVNYRRTGRWQ